MKLTKAELAAAVNSVSYNKFHLTAGVFVEESAGGSWFIGRESLDFSEPETLGEDGVWGGSRYFSTPLDALETAKKYGFLPLTNV